MIDKRTMTSLLMSMESVAISTLQQDPAFSEALHALKWEIDNDPDVQLAVRNLQAAGQSVSNSFVPLLKVRVRTEEGIFALAAQPETSTLVPQRVGALTQELKNAAGAVIVKSHRCVELNRIVNEAVAADHRFEKMACEIENAGYEVLLSLDLSAYAQVRQSSTPVYALPAAKPIHALEPARRPDDSKAPAKIKLTAYDQDFLRTLKIKVDDSLPY